MKVAVYAIAKDEILHAQRWAEATKGADYRIVADTGSTDGTQEKLRELGVTVHQIHLDPFCLMDHMRHQHCSYVQCRYYQHA